MSTTQQRPSRRRFLGLVAGAATGLIRRGDAWGRAPRRSPMTHRQRIENALALAETDRLPLVAGGTAPTRIVPHGGWPSRRWHSNAFE